MVLPERLCKYTGICGNALSVSRTSMPGLASGFGEVVNPAYEEGVSMHPVAWTLTSLDASTETRTRELVKKAES